MEILSSALIGALALFAFVLLTTFLTSKRKGRKSLEINSKKDGTAELKVNYVRKSPRRSYTSAEEFFNRKSQIRRLDSTQVRISASKNKYQSDNENLGNRSNRSSGNKVGITERMTLINNTIEF
ncbi:MAG: hypothetical protein K9H48_12420 [Melioribacteraceae bacterium]|nr:hypothetical protein [Melioribacteraceae bacterium]MCF8395563.1 hypothetical protein [Melioribacteraceae bacterium]